MHLGDVVDQLLDQHGLADARTAEEPDLAALGVRRKQVDHLDPGDEDFRGRRLLVELGRGGMDRAALGRDDGALFVHGFTHDVEDAPERGVAHRHGDRGTRIRHRLAAHEAFGRVHRHGADGVFAQVLGHFEHQRLAVVVGRERVEDRRQMIPELHVHDGTDHLGNPALCTCHLVSPFVPGRSSASGIILWCRATACRCAQASVRSSRRSIRPMRSSSRSIRRFDPASWVSR